MPLGARGMVAETIAELLARMAEKIAWVAGELTKDTAHKI